MAAATESTLEQHDDDLDEAAFLATVPALLPAAQFRQRQRSKLIFFSLQLSEIVDKDGKVDVENRDSQKVLLELLGDADEFFESIAADSNAYVDWSKGLKDSEAIFGRLIGIYARAVGE
jgi:hypothetical protein